MKLILDNPLIFIMLFSIFFIRGPSIGNFTIYELSFLILFTISIYKLKFNFFKGILNTISITLLGLTLLFLYKSIIYHDYFYELLVTLFLVINFFLFYRLLTLSPLSYDIYYVIKSSFIIIYITQKFLKYSS